MSGKIWVTDIKDMVLNFTEIDESALGEWRVRRNRGGEPPVFSSQAEESNQQRKLRRNSL